MSQDVVLAVCVSERKGTPKRTVDRAVLETGRGIVGDAHAGTWHRQVSLLAQDEIDVMRAQGLDLVPGAFGENLVIDGVDLGALGIGSRLAVGDVELEITQIGKVCHSRCVIFETAGDCIMPRAGIFSRVVAGGVVAAGAAVRIVERVDRARIQAGVLTISDRCAAGQATDTAGPAVGARLVEGLGGHIAWTGIVPDDAAAISDALRSLAGRGLDLVITVGGTGFGPRDVTPEATRAVLERDAPGLAEAMRASSAMRTPHALLQRGVAGIRERTLIVNLPGSENAAVENFAAIIAALPHAVQLLRGDTSHPTPDPRLRTATSPRNAS